MGWFKMKLALSEKEILQRKIEENEEHQRELKYYEKDVKTKLQKLYDTEDEKCETEIRYCDRCDIDWYKNFRNFLYKKFNKVGYIVFIESQSIGFRIHCNICNREYPKKIFIFRLKKKDLNKPVLDLLNSDDKFGN